MLCLVCNGSAEDITPGGFDGIILNCPTCEPYEITGSVLNKFDEFGPEKRADALKKAKHFAPPGMRPTITTRCV